MSEKCRFWRNDPRVPSTAPVAASPAEPADDDRAGGRMQCAAVMLRRGDDLGDVAIATEVPLALLELLRDEAIAAAELAQQRRTMDRYLRRRRWVMPIVAALEFIAVANVAIGLVAMAGHVAGLGLPSTLVAAALLVAVYALVTRAWSPTRWFSSSEFRDGHDDGQNRRDTHHGPHTTWSRAQRRSFRGTSTRPGESR